MTRFPHYFGHAGKQPQKTQKLQKDKTSFGDDVPYISVCKTQKIELLHKTLIFQVGSRNLQMFAKREAVQNYWEYVSQKQQIK